MSISKTATAAAGAASLLTTPSSTGTDLLCTISSSGDCVALCTSDNVIKFYDTLTSTLKQEYASSTHLKASCTCLSWYMHHNQKVKRQAAAAAAAIKQKKLKSTPQTTSSSSIESKLIDLNLIAIGTAQGAILLYSLTKEALHSQLVNYYNVFFKDKRLNQIWAEYGQFKAFLRHFFY